jgi:hypothetical protein
MAGYLLVWTAFSLVAYQARPEQSVLGLKEFDDDKLVALDPACHGELTMAAVQIVNRSSLIQGLYRELVLDPRQTAIVTVGMHTAVISTWTSLPCRRSPRIRSG